MTGRLVWPPECSLRETEGEGGGQGGDGAGRPRPSCLHVGAGGSLGKCLKEMW